MERNPCVYIISNKPHGTLYIGVTSNLSGRIWQHKNKVCKGFTEKYNLQYLVWYEVHNDMQSAISREKQLKNWRRDWKLELVNQFNPEWKDLYKEII